MVVEHTFVTTLEGPEAMAAAAGFLSRRGFTSGSSAFPVGAAGPAAGAVPAAWSTLEMSRGKKNGRGAKNVSELPQSVRIDFDRGRVNLAVSITPTAGWGGGSFGGTPDATHKRVRTHATLITAIASSLENLLAHRQPEADAALPWDQAQQEVERLGRRRRTRNIVFITIFVVFIAAMIGLIVAATSR